MKPTVSVKTTASGAKTRTRRVRGVTADFVVPASNQKNQRATDGRDNSTPVAVDPIASNSEFQRNQHSAEKCPPCRKPGLQHPKNRGAHRGNAQEHADPWMSK